MRHNATNKTGYAKRRAAVIERGLSLRRWALNNNVAVGSVYAALRGTRHGPKAVAIRRQLEAYINA